MEFRPPVYADVQLTSDEAIALYDSRIWEKWDAASLFAFQLGQERLCIPFKAFVDAASIALGRPVWDFEFADGKALQDELYGRKPKATPVDIAGALTEFAITKTVILLTSKEKGKG